MSSNYLTIEQQYQVLQDHTKEKLSSRKLAERYKCSKTQILNALKKKDEIIAEYERSFDASNYRKMTRINYKYQKTDERAIEWYRNAIATGDRVSGPMLQQKAIEFSKEVNETDFLGSNGWLNSFCKRHGISFLCKNGKPSTKGKRKATDDEEFENADEDAEAHPKIYDLDYQTFHALANGTTPSQTTNVDENQGSKPMSTPTFAKKSRPSVLYDAEKGDALNLFTDFLESIGMDSRVVRNKKPICDYTDEDYEKEERALSLKEKRARLRQIEAKTEMLKAQQNFYDDMRDQIPLILEPLARIPPMFEHLAKIPDLLEPVANAATLLLNRAAKNWNESPTTSSSSYQEPVQSNGTHTESSQDNHYSSPNVEVLMSETSNE